MSIINSGRKNIWIIGQIPIFSESVLAIETHVEPQINLKERNSPSNFKDYFS